MSKFAANFAKFHPGLAAMATLGPVLILLSLGLGDHAWEKWASKDEYWVLTGVGGLSLILTGVVLLGGLWVAFERMGWWPTGFS